MVSREPSLDRNNNEINVYPATSNDLERNTAAYPPCLSLPIIQFYRGCSVYMYPTYGSYKTADTSLFVRLSLIVHGCLGALLSPARTCFNGTDCNKVRLTYINAVNWKETICRSPLAKHKRTFHNDFHYYTHVQLPFLPYSWFNLKMDPSKVPFNYGHLPLNHDCGEKVIFFFFKCSNWI